MGSPLEQMSEDALKAYIQRAFEGDQEAMAHLIEQISPIVHTRVARALMRRKTQSKGRDLRQELEDLIQDVFASLLHRKGKALKAWEPTRGLSFERFVGFLAEREVSLKLRTHKSNPWTEDPTQDRKLVRLVGSDHSVHAQMESRDLLKRLSGQLKEQLSPKGRLYFELLYIENLSVQAVVEQTGTTADALYAWRSRLTKMLRKLKRDLETEPKHHV